ISEMAPGGRRRRPPGGRSDAVPGEPLEGGVDVRLVLVDAGGVRLLAGAQEGDVVAAEDRQVERRGLVFLVGAVLETAAVAAVRLREGGLPLLGAGAAAAALAGDVHVGLVLVDAGGVRLPAGAQEGDVVAAEDRQVERRGLVFLPGAVVCRRRRLVVPVLTAALLGFGLRPVAGRAAAVLVGDVDVGLVLVDAGGVRLLAGAEDRDVVAREDRGVVGGGLVVLVGVVADLAAGVAAVPLGVAGLPLVGVGAALAAAVLVGGVDVGLVLVDAGGVGLLAGAEDRDVVAREDRGVVGRGLVVLIRPVLGIAAAGPAGPAGVLVGGVDVGLVLLDAGRVRLVAGAEDRDVVAGGDRHVGRRGLVLLVGVVAHVGAVAAVGLRAVRRPGVGAAGSAVVLVGGVDVGLVLLDAGRVRLVDGAEDRDVVAGGDRHVGR